MGFDGVIVSNHGGRQLDGSPSPLDVIEEIRSAVGDKYCLMMDGGVRTGRDVFKAIALGADAVLVGRPVIWALARQGAGGVTEFFQELKRDLVNTMKLAGVRRIQDIQRSKVSKK
jgi:isopentenyl diphosphate isomerase/L-lactate dehydrogenase-like FMN-dependent dehydrogenase